jgi:hypothetical protein
MPVNGTPPCASLRECPPRTETRRGAAALRVAKACQQPPGSRANKNTDEVRDQRDRPDDTGVVVTRTAAEPLRSVADGDSPGNDHSRQDAPSANGEPEGQTDEKPRKAENDAQSDQAHGIQSANALRNWRGGAYDSAGRV